MSIKVKIAAGIACIVLVYFLYIITPLLKAYSFAKASCEVPSEIVVSASNSGGFDWSKVAEAKNATAERYYGQCIRGYIKQYGLKQASND
ncbi:TPA: hypothetical protein ACKQDY_000962 [Serratia marcescens]|nr:hypothetical protein [Serratia marcescens]